MQRNLGTKVASDTFLSRTYWNVSDDRVLVFASARAMQDPEARPTHIVSVETALKAVELEESRP